MKEVHHPRVATRAIRLPRSIANQIFDQVRGEIEREVCGLIAAREGIATRTLPVPNIATRPECRYRMDPAALVDALYDIEARGETLFAIYHSHPHGPSRPSVIDIAEAEYPEAIYFIVSLDTKGVLEMRGFRIQGGRAVESELEIQGD
jgi:proteasome lid subunit RPN8/RPN11